MLGTTIPGRYLNVAIAKKSQNLLIKYSTFATICQWNYLVAKVDKYNWELHWLFGRKTFLSVKVGVQHRSWPDLSLRCPISQKLIESVTFASTIDGNAQVGDVVDYYYYFTTTRTRVSTIMIRSRDNQAIKWFYLSSTSSVWPDLTIKVAQTFHKVAPKVATTFFSSMALWAISKRRTF